MYQLIKFEKPEHYDEYELKNLHYIIEQIQILINLMQINLENENELLDGENEHILLEIYEKQNDMLNNL
jgi:hypothetical protein